MKVAIVVILLLALWQSVASMVFLLVGGLFGLYPYPQKLWMIWVYLLRARDQPGAMVWWAGMAFMVGAVVTLFFAVPLWMTRRPLNRSRSDVYGKTEWADRRAMHRGGVRSYKRPL